MSQTSEHHMVARARVVDAAVAKFKHQTLTWGEYDCSRLAHDVLSGLGLQHPFAVPAYASERAALRTMRKAGFKSLADACGACATPIPPAMAIIGDLLGFPEAGNGFGMALGLMLSGGRCLAFVDHESLAAPTCFIGHTIKDATRAWRLPLGPDPIALKQREAR